MSSKSKLFLHLVALVFVVSMACNNVSAQQIIVDPDQMGADDVVMFVPGIFITIPLPDPIPVPTFDTGANRLWVGNTSYGKLIASGGAQIYTPVAAIGNEQSSVGSMSLSGTGTFFEVSFFMDVGNFGHGSLHLSDGANALVDSQLLVAREAGSTGIVTLTDPGTTLDLNSDLGVLTLGSDDSSDAIINVLNGAELVTGLHVFAHKPTFGEAIVRVEGSGSRISGISTEFELQDQLYVLDGASVELEQIEAVGPGIGQVAGEAVVQVAGSESRLDIGQALIIGNQSFGDRRGRLIISNRATVTANQVFVGRTLNGFDNGSVMINGGASLHIDSFINAMPDSVQFTGGILSFAGDRQYTAGLFVTGFDSILTERNGILTDDETLRVEGNLDAQSPISVLDATLSAGSITGMSNIDLIRGRVELSNMPLEISMNSETGSSMVVSNDQEYFVVHGVNIAADGWLELDGGVFETSTIENSGQFRSTGNEVSEIVGDFINFADMQLDGGSNTILFGDLELESNSSLEISIRNSIGGPGQMEVLGLLSLRGELSIDLQNGFEPGSSSEFVVMAASQISGQFDNAASGERLITKTGSFVVHYGSGSPYGSNQIVLTDFQNNVLLGDVNGDGSVDLLDVQPFVEVISAGGFVSAADINQDGEIDLLDVQPFIELLTN